MRHTETAHGDGKAADTRGRKDARARRPRRRVLRTCLLSAVVVGGLIGGVGAASAQTIEGRLLDLESGMPIPLGLVMMFTESGDSVTATVADEVGRFRISATEAGSYVLNAAALGYEETPAGVFELGEGGTMTVEYRLTPQPLAIDAMVVSLRQPVRAHHMVRNGFVRRMQRGLGAFITPYEIAQSPARSTEELMAQVPNVRVGPVMENTDGFILPRGDIGETVQLRRLDGSWCSPTLYVDGRKVDYEPSRGFTLSMMADRQSVEGIEIYRRPAEIPVEYNARPGFICGVIVVWTKVGLAPGQRGSSRTAGNLEVTEDGGLPPVEERGSPPEEGERIRVALSPEASESLGLAPAWSGTFIMATDSTLVATDPGMGRAFALPLTGVRNLQVLRRRPSSHAWLRGAVAGAAMGGGTWLGLSTLCDWSDCGTATIRSWIPSAVVGFFVGLLVQRMGPGDHWVAAPPRFP